MTGTYRSAFTVRLFSRVSYYQRAAPVDFAVTFAALLGVNQPSAAIGHVLTEALKPATSTAGNGDDTQDTAPRSSQHEEHDCAGHAGRRAPRVKPDMRVRLCGLELRNPVIAASGTFGYGIEFEEILSLDKIGGFVTKGLSREPMAGNEAPRIIETASGMINAIGLQNMGAAAFIA